MGSAIGELTGANQRAANAASGAAQAQEASAAQQQQAAISAAESPQQLKALESALGKQEANLNKQASLFAALDPAILEASSQALKLLKGQEAQTLGPLKQQRSRQRQQLVNRLREQLGPGAETGSAGMQALNQFDQQTSEQLNTAQQSSLSQLFGIGSQGAAGRSALGQGAATLANIGGGFGNIAQRKVNAITGTSGAVVGSAGSQFVGQQLRAQQQQGIGSDIFTAGTSLARGGFFNPTKKKPQGQGQTSTEAPGGGNRSQTLLGTVFGP